MHNKDFHLTEEVIEYLADHKVDLTAFLDMLAHSARVTHNNGNRRFHQYIFEVQGNEVFNVFNMDDNTTSDHECRRCKDTGKLPVFDECLHCNGVGCHHCDEGLVRNFIFCPDCGKKSLTLIR